MDATKILTFDRWDFLATRILLILIGVAAPALLVILPLWDWARGNPLTWSVDLDVAGLSTTAVSARPGAQLAWEGAARVTIEQPTTAVWLATLIPQALVAVAVLAVVVVLYRLMARIQGGAPFDQSSVRGLRMIALILLIAPWVILPFSGYADSSVVREALKVSELNSFTLFTGSLLVVMGVGLMIAAVAEAFAQGHRMQADVEGLV